MYDNVMDLNTKVSRNNEEGKYCISCKTFPADLLRLSYKNFGVCMFGMGEAIAPMHSDYVISLFDRIDFLVCVVLTEKFGGYHSPL